jgi:hypothetical protein
MNIYISPFVLGVICTIGSEIIALILTVMFFSLKHSRKTRRNASNSQRRDIDE